MKLKNTKNVNLASLMLRLGIAIVFFYAAIYSLRQPLIWQGYLPSFLTKMVNAKLALQLIAVYEIILGLWLLFNKYTRLAAALSALTFAGIILANLSQLIVTFRDVGLLFAALALFFIED